MKHAIAIALLVLALAGCCKHDENVKIAYIRGYTEGYHDAVIGKVAELRQERIARLREASKRSAAYADSVTGVR